MRFTKMQGIGNDFILVDGFHQAIADPAGAARRLCDRHFGVGADGLILALPSETCDARMRIFNSDGSEPEMCGNGIRCLGRFLAESGLCGKNPMSVETGGGVKLLRLDADGGVTVDMGAPCFAPEKIPVAAASNEITLDLEGVSARFFCVSMGNPHAVTFDLFPEEETFLRLGAMLERHPVFPRRANIEFCRLNPDGGVDVKVWERGDGPTLACGTGACATLAAGVSLGLLPREAPVRLPGGTLRVCWSAEGSLLMTGPAETVFTGELPV